MLRRSLPSVALTAAFAVALAPCLAVADAPASEPDDDAFERAEAVRQEALAAYETGDLETTLEKFKAAYEIDPSPAYLFNIGRVYEEMGELESALDYYETFARQPRLRLEEREQAAERIEILRKLVKPKADPGPQAPANAPEQTNDPAEPQPAPEKDDVPPKQSKPLIIAGSALLGLGAAVALGGGLGLGLAARNRSDRVESITPGNNPEGLTLSDVEDLDAQGRTFELWQIVTAAGGGAIAVTGAVLLSIGMARRSKAKGSARVLPVYGRGVAGVSIHTRF